MTRFLKVTPALLLAGLFTSCGPTAWTEAQKTNLGSISLKRTSVAADAYQKPDGTDSPNASSTVPTATGGGLIPALIGVAIDASVTSVQQSNFEKEHGSHFDGSKRNVPGDLANRFSQKLDKSLRKDSFFRSRLNPAGTASIGTTVTRYGYQRVSENDDGVVLVSPVVGVDLLITGSDGKELLKQSFSSPGASPALLKEYSSDPKKASKAFDGELDWIITEIESVLAIRVGAN